MGIDKPDSSFPGTWAADPVPEQPYPFPVAENSPCPYSAYPSPDYLCLPPGPDDNETAFGATGFEAAEEREWDAAGKATGRRIGNPAR